MVSLRMLFPLVTMILVIGVSARSQMDPMKIDLNGDWLFAEDSLNVGLGLRWFNPSFDRSGWRSVPSSAEGDHVTDPTGRSTWFALTFSFEKTSEPVSIFSHGIDGDADIWVNGLVAAVHAGYAESFAFDVSASLQNGENLIVVRLHDGRDHRIATRFSLVESRHVDDLQKSPYFGRSARRSADWVRDGVLYEIYPRSFSPEGSFSGIEKRVPELRDMGVSVLWLMPIHPVGVKKRKGTLGSPYAVRDYYAINPEFGTLEDFKRLLRVVHTNGMKLIVDFVANHTAWDSRLVEEHRDWFTKDSSGNIVSPNADWTDVADLDYTNADLRRYMTEVMVWWVRDVGIDGFRCDVADLVPTDFWESARERLERIKPVLMLSEGSLPEHHIKAFDYTYSWNIYDVLSGLLAGKLPVTVIDDVLKRESLRFPVGSLRLRFASNHDKNAWDAPAAEKFGVDGLTLCQVLVNTLPGVPLLYNGDEVGDTVRLDLFEKVPIVWHPDREMKKVLHILFTLRHQHKALSRGAMVRLHAGDDEHVYAFLRIAGNDRILVVLNPGESPRSASITIPWSSVFPGIRKLTFSDAFGNNRIESMPGTEFPVTIPPRGFQVYIAE